MKQPMKLGLRVWFTLTSLVSFLVGWMLISHANKPVSLIPEDNSNVEPSTLVSVVNPLPTLQPLPSLKSQGSGTSSLQSLPSINNSVPQSSFPRLRGRGS
jgi:hypothetical protein